MRKINSSVLFTVMLIGVFLLSSYTTVQAADETAAWYYDNLDDADRLKIRKAMDMCVPRDQIVDGLHQGWAQKIATPIGSQFSGVYVESIQPRAYDTAAALALLTEVFGYEYDDSAEDETAEPYFSMVLVAPTTNEARTQWASLISKAFTGVGIDVQMKWWNWNIIVPRIFTDPIDVGFDYEHGGYDVYFIGWSASADPNYQSMYGSEYLVPNGDNAGWIENDEVDAIWEQALYDLDPAERIEGLKDFQQWYYDNVPASIIRQAIDLYAMDKEMEGFDTYLGGYYFQNLTHPTQTSMTYTVPGDFVDLNPVMSNSYYDFVAISQVHGSLTTRRGLYNLTHPVGFLAESWTSSTDGLVWDVKLREGVKWSDGTEVTADDVVFSYQAPFDEDIGAASRATVVSIFGNASAITKVDKYNVKFTLPSFHPYMATQGLGLSILQKAQMSVVPVAEWASDDTNTKTTPIGFGPYMFDSTYSSTGGYDGVSKIKLITNPEYNGTLMGHNPNAVGGGIFFQEPALDPVIVEVVKDATLAVTGLSTGVYDIIDAQTGIQAQALTINASSWGKLVSALEWGWQEMVYNQYSPIWGMNPGDPRQMYPSTAPWDFTSVLIAIFAIAGFQVIRKKRN